MNSFSLAKKALKKPFEKDLISMIAPSYLILIGIGQLTISYQEDLSSNTSLLIFAISYLFALIGPLIFYPILIEWLRANTSKSKFIFPKSNLILRKAWKIFIAGILPTIFILLGTLCFIIPGIFLAKRYIYVTLIVENEMIGPIDAMRKSRALSQKNGWKIILASIFCAIIYFIFSIPITFLLNPEINPNSGFPLILSTLITIIYGWFTTVGTGSIPFFGYLNANNKSNS